VITSALSLFCIVYLNILPSYQSALAEVHVGGGARPKMKAWTSAISVTSTCEFQSPHSYRPRLDKSSISLLSSVLLAGVTLGTDESTRLEPKNTWNGGRCTILAPMPCTNWQTKRISNMTWRQRGLLRERSNRRRLETGEHVYRTRPVFNLVEPNNLPLHVLCN
jgi:hypothetical protein